MKFLKRLLFLGILCSQSVFAQIPTVQIDSVTVLNDQQVLIDWKVSTNSTVDGYYVYRLYTNNLDQMIFDAPITINGRLNHTLTYTDAFGAVDLPSQKSLRFWVTAFDKDVNPIVQSGFDTTAVKPHQTMYFDQSVDPCNGQVNINWNDYANNLNGWADGISRYEVWESQNGGPFRIQYIGNNKNYTRRGLMTGIDYKYKIRAVSADLQKTSTSNSRNFNGTFSVAPSFIYLFNATVAANNRTITLNWLSDTSSCNLSYSILMSEDSVNYKEVARIDSATYKKIRILPIDNVLAERFAYYFKIVTTTACPDTIDTSNVVRVVRLKAEYIDPITNRLTWNDYEGWPVGTGYYELYRVKKDSAGINVQDLIATLTPPQTDYIDIDLGPAGLGNSTYYFMKIYEQINDPFNIQSTSLSNQAYIYREVKIIAPDVFTPNGLTPIFRPRVLSTNNNKFNMKIFNRWGKLVFETDDEIGGWDGKDKDSHDVCPTGAYIYLIETTDASGTIIRKKGAVALID